MHSRFVQICAKAFGWKRNWHVQEMGGKTAVVEAEREGHGIR